MSGIAFIDRPDLLACHGHSLSFGKSGLIDPETGDFLLQNQIDFSAGGLIAKLDNALGFLFALSPYVMRPSNCY